MRISEKFNLRKDQRELDFVDIDINGDLPLFLDPHHISIQTSQIALEASFSIQTFFEKLLLLLQNDNADLARHHLRYIGEINEVHLGLSKGKSQGKGIGFDNSSDLISSIINSLAMKSGLIEELNDSRLFIKGIASDKISDLCANVIRKVLLSYTNDQCVLWGIPLAQAQSGYYWDPEEKNWKNDLNTSRLIIDGRFYLLVPKEFVSYKSDYTPDQYRQQFVLNYLQDENLRLDTTLVQVRRNKKGEIIRRYVTKKSILDDLAENGIVPNKEWLYEFTLKHKEVLDKFKKEAKISGELFTGNETTTTEIQKLINALIYNLQAIDEGNDAFDEYEKTILGISELLFYPDLCNPQRQAKINEGRKRIDLVFTNIARSGLFNRLRDINDIPCNFIMVECKNYSKDITNPELDQMIGRFSNNRGKMGLIFCRHLDNQALFVNRCKDTFKDGNGLILHITDEIVIQLLNEYKEHFEKSYNSILSKMVDNIMLS